MRAKRPIRQRAPTAWTICLLLLLLGSLSAGYFTLRYAARWSDSDSGALTAAIAAVADEGTLQPSGAAYSLGFAYQAVSVLLVSLTGLQPTQLQFQVYPLIAGMLTVVAFAMYRALTGSTVAGALATLLLLLQPDFLFVVFRGSHEKVTWLATMLATYLLARSFRALREPERFASHVGLFYLAVLTIIASNTFFGSSFVAAVWVALVAGSVLLRVWRRQWPDERRQMTVSRLASVVAAAMVLWYLVVFYLYPPAMRFLLEINSTAGQVGAVAAGVEARYDPYAGVSQAWVSQTAYFGVTLPTWITALTSFAIWVATGLRWLRARHGPRQSPEFLMWSLCGGFGVQLAAGALLAAAGGTTGNLQVRMFPAFMLVAVALVATYLHELWRTREGGPKRVFLALSICAFVLWASAASLLKATNEPTLVGYWNFWTVSEERTVQWVDGHVRNASVWLGPSAIRATGRAVAARFGKDSNNRADSGRVDVDVRDLLLSVTDGELALMINLAPPDVRPENRVYDNGDAQMYHKVPRTPYQR